MKNKKPTITVGIPAYNEEANIESMLMSVLKQKTNSFKMEKIIVICDGSRDRTGNIVHQLSKEYPIIRLRIGKGRLGKAKRINQLYNLNKSDFLAVLDADIVLGSTNLLNEILKDFIKHPEILVCSINNLPVPQQSFIGKVSNSSFMLWQEASQIYRNGNNVHTNFGSASIIRKSFIKHVIIPDKTANDQGFLYFKARQVSDKSYLFSKKHSVYFQAVSTLKDYLLQGTRAVHTSKKQMINVFGDFAVKEYKIPLRYKIQAIINRLISDPLYTSLAMVLRIYIQLFPYKDKLNNKGFWEIVNSSKKNIKLRFN